MALARQSSQSCSTCGQTAGIFICRGCSQSFCLPHTNEHRQQLEKRMNQILFDHKNLKINRKDGGIYQQLRQQVDLWHQQSIEKIQRVADEIRNELSRTVRYSDEQFNEQIKKLAADLQSARNNGEFFENDLKRWSEQIQRLCHISDNQERIQIIHEKDSIAFIPRIALSHGSIMIEKSNADQSQSLQINESSDNLEDYSLMEELNNYSTGEHSLHFKIEQYQADCCLRFGVISAKYSDDPYFTFYGWGEDDFVYISGVPEEKYGDYFSDYQANDLVLLTIDCNQRMISLTNERTHRIHCLNIDLHKCPFPWQPYIRFFLHQE